MKGTVKWFKDDPLFTYILGEDGKRYNTSFTFREGNFNLGDTVTFEVSSSNGVAFNIEHSSEETFTKSQIESAIKSFLDYGEESYDPDREVCSGDKSHGGYFSGIGFAARALRYHLKQLQES